MLTIDNYCDRAKAQSNIKSDRKLADALGITSPSLSQYRRKRAWPSDNTMVKLAELAGLDPKQGLLYLSTWRAEGKALELFIEIANEYLKGNASSLEQKFFTQGMTNNNP